MAKLKIYDKVAWHFPEGKNCPNIETAKRHFVAIMNWLAFNELLSAEGKEFLELGIDSDFSLTSAMLNNKGNQVLEKAYEKWIKTIDYKKEISTKLLDLFL